MSNFLIYWNTIKFLRFNQIIYRIPFYFKPNLNNFIEYKLNKLDKSLVNVKTNHSLDQDNKIKINNVEYKIDNNFPWNNFSQNKIDIYTLNYLNFINDDHLDKNNTKKIILDWINNNNCKDLISWDPYPLSLRIINLTRWCINNQDFDEKILNSIYLQLRWLNKRIEYHISGNHLLTNFKALTYASCLFNSYEANKYFSRGLKQFKKYLERQTLEDGGHYERSPMYHSIITKDLIELLDLLKKIKLISYSDYISFLENKIDKYLNFYNYICHPDNLPSFFADTNFDNSYSLTTLKSLAHHVMGKSKFLKSKDNLKIFKTSGYFSFMNDNYYCSGDIGDFYKTDQPGHSHAASLSFELTLFGERVFVNSGISNYQDNQQRYFERSTKAHNTLEIDHSNSSQVWKSFRLGNRAKIISYNYKRTDEYYEINAEHDGYSTNNNSVIHNRAWSFYNKEVKITDTVRGNFQSARARYYLHPDIKFINDNSLCLKSGKIIKLLYEGAELQIKDVEWYPYFNKKQSSTCIELLLNSDVSQLRVLL